jgi:tyrosyl-tRNA synthetase
MRADALTLLKSGTAEIHPQDGLEQKLALARPLRVKFGIDPSRPDLTLGHTVVFRKLRQFQDAGHVAVLIIGDFTARIGDPSGQSETRPMLTQDEVAGNARTYLEQAAMVIDVERAEVHGNAEWGAAMDMGQLLALASTATVAQMLEREDFRDRYREGRPISVVEVLYPLFQGYDSVAVRSDIELGGTDQTFNLLMAREVQRAYGLDPQAVVTTPLLEGLDGLRKMSKSLDNYVALTDPPDEMFGKLMSIPDALIAKYELLCTDLGLEDHDRVVGGLADGSIHPNDEKRRMARAIVDLYHGPGAGSAAEARFDRVHRAHEIPDDVAEVTLPTGALRDGKAWLPRVLVVAGLAVSNGEARRKVAEGGVRLDGALLGDPDQEFDPADLVGKVLQVGRRKFARIAGVVE